MPVHNYQLIEVQQLSEAKRKLEIPSGGGLGTLSGATNPNGVVTGIIGQMFTQVVGNAATIWVNIDGGTTWS